MRQWNFLCRAGPIEKAWYAASWPMASQHSLPQGSSPRSPPRPWHAPWGLCNPLLLPVLAACSCDAASSWGSCGWGWLATVALHHTAPLWLNLHCKPVRPLHKGTCCCPLEGLQGWLCPGHGAACPQICPQIYFWLVPMKYFCQWIRIIMCLITWASGESLSLDFDVIYLKN